MSSSASPTKPQHRDRHRRWLTRRRTNTIAPRTVPKAAVPAAEAPKIFHSPLMISWYGLEISTNIQQTRVPVDLHWITRFGYRSTLSPRSLSGLKPQGIPVTALAKSCESANFDFGSRPVVLNPPARSLNVRSTRLQRSLNAVVGVACRRWKALRRNKLGNQRVERMTVSNVAGRKVLLHQPSQVGRRSNLKLKPVLFEARTHESGRTFSIKALRALCNPVKNPSAGFGGLERGHKSGIRNGRRIGSNKGFCKPNAPAPVRRAVRAHRKESRVV